MLTHGTGCEHNRLVGNYFGVGRATHHLSGVFLLLVFNAEHHCCS